MKGKFLTLLYTDISITIAGLVLFFAIFTLMLATVYLRRDSRAHYDAIARLPLGDGEDGVHEQR
jgi:cbb3-type cytochrome oxidase subunit 3